MANTTNFNWETPDDTDLVKDGAAAIRTLGSSIDTSLVDLKGGTTGQVLSKATNTDMDFTWVAQDDSNAIQNAIVDAKGDIIAASANDTPARLAVGTNNHRLVAASGETTGLKYVADTQNTVIDAEGDLLVGDAADAVQRLAIGSNAQVLTVDTAVDGKIKWATPAGGSSTFVGCYVYDSGAGQSIPNATYTIRNFNTELYDTDGFHDNSTNNSRITIPTGKGGYYLVRFNQILGTSTTGSRFYYILKNGSLAGQHAGTPSAVNPIHEGGRVMNLVAGDYLQLEVFQSSGGALNYGTTSDGGYFSVAFLGA